MRAEKGVRQVDLADSLGVPQQYISRFENGETRMDVVQFWLYCQALDVSFARICKQLDRQFSTEGRPRRPVKAKRQRR